MSSRKLNAASLPNKEKEGWLLSTAKKKKDFEPLYFVLSHRLLYYFREKDSPKPLGYMEIRGRSVGAQREHRDQTNVFFLSDPSSGKKSKRVWMSAADTTDLQDWVNLLVEKAGAIPLMDSDSCSDSAEISLSSGGSGSDGGGGAGGGGSGAIEQGWLEYRLKKKKWKRFFAVAGNLRLSLFKSEGDAQFLRDVQYEFPIAASTRFGIESVDDRDLSFFVLPDAANAEDDDREYLCPETRGELRTWLAAMQLMSQSHVHASTSNSMVNKRMSGSRFFAADSFRSLRRQSFTADKEGLYAINWLNRVLEGHPSYKVVMELERDLCDGVLLSALMDVMEGDGTAVTDVTAMVGPDKRKHVELVEHARTRMRKEGINVRKWTVSDVVSGAYRPTLRMLNAVSDCYGPPKGITEEDRSKLDLSAHENPEDFYRNALRTDANLAQTAGVGLDSIEGWLDHKYAKNKWRRHYVVLEGRMLNLYATKHEFEAGVEASAVFNVSQGDNFGSDSDVDGHEWCFHIAGIDGREYFAAETEAEHRAWLFALGMKTDTSVRARSAEDRTDEATVLKEWINGVTAGASGDGGGGGVPRVEFLDRDLKDGIVLSAVVDALLGPGELDVPDLASKKQFVDILEAVRSRLAAADIPVDRWQVSDIVSGAYKATVRLIQSIRSVYPDGVPPPPPPASGDEAVGETATPGAAPADDDGGEASSSEPADDDGGEASSSEPVPVDPPAIAVVDAAGVETGAAAGGGLSMVPHDEDGDGDENPLSLSQRSVQRLAVGRRMGRVDSLVAAAGGDYHLGLAAQAVAEGPDGVGGSRSSDTIEDDGDVDEDEAAARQAAATMDKLEVVVLAWARKVLGEAGLDLDRWPIADAAEDFRDGIVLMMLVVVWSGKAARNDTRRPETDEEREHCVTAVLKVLESRGIEVPAAEDILTGHRRETLKLLARMMRDYLAEAAEDSG